MDWRERWEQDADAELAAFHRLSLDDLVQRIRRGQLGNHHVIWNALVAKQDLPAVGWLLFDFAKSNAEYLHRYHAARALLDLLGCETFQPADLTVSHLKPAAALAEVEQLLREAIGSRQ